MQPELDYEKIGRRIRAARQKKGMSQFDLGALVGCSNNHMSHVETGQTKVSLPMLLKIAYALDTDLDYFLLDTPYAQRGRLIDEEISAKLQKCNTATLVAANQMLDILLQQQEALGARQETAD